MKEINKEDRLYPKRLKEINNAPKKIYIEGNKKILNEISISVIGSRSHSDYGRRMCEKFTKELVENGINIVSGMALGIDSIAHKTCIKNGGKTIAVLPSGLENIFPKQNKGLYTDIIDSGGTVISEYIPEFEANSNTCLKRNRIVSGLSIGTLVIEAGYRSGTSVTARLATEQGRKVFVIPSSLENRNGCTSNEIIQKGAKLVTCIEDILDEYPEIEYKENKQISNTEKHIKEEFKTVYEILSSTPMHINEICKKLDLSISEVNYKLTMLELEESIIQLPGKEFIRK